MASAEAVEAAVSGVCLTEREILDFRVLLEDVQAALRDRGLDPRQHTLSFNECRVQSCDCASMAIDIGLKFGAMEGLTHPEPLALFMDPVDFSNCVFESEFSIDFGRFHKPLTCFGARFKAPCHMLQVLFESEASFERCTFERLAYLHGARFAHRPSFVDARFEDYADLGEIDFVQGADFRRAHFMTTVYFGDSRFSGGVDFSKAIFEDHANFWLCYLSNHCRFTKARFNGRAEFRNARITGFLALSDADLGPEGVLDIADIEHC